MISSPTSTRRIPQVQAEILKIMGFWIQLGVSGFRMDAVPFVIATKGAEVRTPREQYDMLRAFREFLQWREGDAIILAEANVLPRDRYGIFRRRRRPHAHDVQLPGQPESVLRAGVRRHPAAGEGAERRPRRGRQRRSGAFSCATTTSSISAV